MACQEKQQLSKGDRVMVLPLTAWENYLQKSSLEFPRGVLARRRCYYYTRVMQLVTDGWSRTVRITSITQTR